MSDIEVTGGAGGTEVAIDDLLGAAVGLRLAADHLSEHTPRDASTHLTQAPSPASGVDWHVFERALGAPIHLAPLAAQCRHALTEAIARASLAAQRLRDLAETVIRAAAEYARVERSNARMIGGLHDQAMGLAWLVTTATGTAFGVLDEGDEGDDWHVQVSETEPRGPVPIPTTTESLLAGLDSLTTDGRIRVIELACADGSTTWVVQVPGTQAGIDNDGANPIDWPSNVSLMLDRTSASKAAVTLALARAQGGRATPGDRVVIAGFSQGGIVAASLASDPDFRSRHRVTHVVTAGSPIDQFPVPDATTVLSLQQRGDPVHLLDVAPAPGRRNWTTVTSRRPARGTGPFRFHDLSLYRGVAASVERSSDVSLARWRQHLAPALTPAPRSRPVVHEYTSKRWQNRAS